MEAWYNISESDALSKLNSKKVGLSTTEASRRREQYGLNALPSGRKLSLLFIFLSQFKGYLTLFLIVAGIIAYMLPRLFPETSGGDSHLSDSIMIFVAVGVNIIFGFIQEARTERTLAKLKKSLKILVHVFRDGEESEIPSKRLVPGDIVYLEQGARVPADIRIITANDVEADESALTGESAPVKKNAKLLRGDKAVGDRTNILHQGTVITSGIATGVVIETGLRTEYGKIAIELSEVEERDTPLQVKVKALSKLIASVVLGAGALIVVVGFIRAQTLGESLSSIFITAVAVAVSAIPEGLVVAITLILTIGMGRLLRRRALVRKLSAAETLGSTSVILSDKTGTLTQGRMHVVDAVTFGNESTSKLLIENALFANAARIENPHDSQSSWRYTGSPTDVALLKYAAAKADNPRRCCTKETKILHSLPFDSEHKYQAAHVQFANKRMVLVNGAPDILLKGSTHYASGSKKIKLTSAKRKEIKSTIDNMSRRGMRLVAAAIAHPSKEKEISHTGTKKSLTFVGLYGIKDPVRSDAKATIHKAARAGVRTIMITGDYALTAKAIAADVGIEVGAGEIITGTELDSMKDKELNKRIKTVKVFARVSPSDKTRIARAFQSQGFVVAMTGDGVNDAPALKAADIGVAIGSGTEIAKEASDMVLLKNNLSVIVEAIRQGRVIFDNIRKVTLYLLFDSFAEVILVVGVMLLGFPLPVTAAQILWINLIGDGLPNLALALEPAEKDIMRQKPRPRDFPLLDKEMKAFIFGLGMAVNVLLIGLFVYLYNTTQDLSYTRTMVFAALAIDTFFIALSIKSLRTPLYRIRLLSNRALLGALAVSMFLLVGAIHLPIFQTLLHTVPLSVSDWTMVVAIGMVSLVGAESIKYFFNKQPK